MADPIGVRGIGGGVPLACPGLRPYEVSHFTLFGACGESLVAFGLIFGSISTRRSSPGWRGGWQMHEPGARRLGSRYALVDPVGNDTRGGFVREGISFGRFREVRSPLAALENGLSQ